MIKKAVKIMYENKTEGDLLMDAPKTRNCQELMEASQDKEGWWQKVRAIKDMIDVTAVMQRGKKKRRSSKRKERSKAITIQGRRRKRGWSGQARTLLRSRDRRTKVMKKMMMIREKEVETEVEE